MRDSTFSTFLGKSCISSCHTLEPPGVDVVRCGAPLRPRVPAPPAPILAIARRTNSPLLLPLSSTILRTFVQVRSCTTYYSALSRENPPQLQLPLCVSRNSWYEEFSSGTADFCQTWWYFGFKWNHPMWNLWNWMSSNIWCECGFSVQVPWDNPTNSLHILTLGGGLT